MITDGMSSPGKKSAAKVVIVAVEQSDAMYMDEDLSMSMLWSVVDVHES